MTVAVTCDDYCDDVADRRSHASKKKETTTEKTTTTTTESNFDGRALPYWAREEIPKWGTRIVLPEWDEDEKITSGNDDDDDGGGDDDVEVCGRGCGSGREDGADEYRSRNGWMGADLCHSIQSPVRITHYAITYGPYGSGGGRGGRGGVGTVLTGLCHFTERAESHRGLCHGGSMTSVMDDVVGWTAFHVTGRCIPWSGYTAQVNVALRRPVNVGSYLTIRGTVVKWEGRKVWIHSKLLSREDGDDGKDEEYVHCTAEGLVILMKDVR